jgi:tetratricopeptide (TPR) repeat protein
MRLAAVFLAAVLSSASGDERAMRMLEDWVRAVDRHTGGEKDEALARIGAWTYDDLESLHGHVEALIDLPITRNTPRGSPRAARRSSISRYDLAAIRVLTRDLQLRGDFDQFRKRAAMLHTDAALLMSSPVVVAPPVPNQRPRWSRGAAAPAVDIKSLDGRVENFEAANPHWQYAMDALESLPARPQRDPMVAQWYRTIGAYFAYEHNFADAMRHFDRARTIVPDDPGVLYGEACLQETLGAPPNQNFVRVANLPNGLVVMGVSEPPVHFRRAESLLKRALSAQPTFVDARLRLGRVLAAQQQFEAALPHFQQVATESSDPALTYYAHLFAGDAALALGKAEDSKTSYARALELHPRAQAARLGLGAALRTMGDRAAALDAVMETLTVESGTRDEFDDPWWAYYDGDAANVERLLDELRAPFRSPGR